MYSRDNVLKKEGWLSTKVPLRFGENNKFRILCVSDVHGGVGYDEEYTVSALQKLLDHEKPDMVLILGDIAGPGMIHIENREQLRQMLTGLTAPLEKAGIPWAHVYGNHDDNFGLDNKDAQPVYEAFPHCVSKFGPKDLTGAGNYVLPIYDHLGEKILFNVFGLDSHRNYDHYNEEFGRTDKVSFDIPGFDTEGGERNVDFCQVMWYYNISKQMEKYTGHKVPALLVAHIPPIELKLASFATSLDPDIIEFMKNWREKGREDSAGPMFYTDHSSGLVRAAMERGDIKAMCFGHDHETAYSMNYNGMELSFDGYLSRHACHLEETFGGRVYDLEAQEDGIVSVVSRMVLIKDL